jgi:predicted RNA-binding Zn-ribbon protein involved in translation (DUF1610 family)
MKYAREKQPYEHTCPECGRRQEVFEYGTDPSFGVGTVEEVGYAVRAEMVVNLNKHFKCTACGYTKHFSDDVINTGETEVLEYGRGNTDIHHAINMIKQKFKKQHEVEEYL